MSIYLETQGRIVLNESVLRGSKTRNPAQGNVAELLKKQITKDKEIVTLLDKWYANTLTMIESDRLGILTGVRFQPTVTTEKPPTAIES